MSDFKITHEHLVVLWYRTLTQTLYTDYLLKHDNPEMKHKETFDHFERVAWIKFEKELMDVMRTEDIPSIMRTKAGFTADTDDIVKKFELELAKIKDIFQFKNIV